MAGSGRQQRRIATVKTYLPVDRVLPWSSAGGIEQAVGDWQLGRAVNRRVRPLVGPGCPFAAVTQDQTTFAGDRTRMLTRERSGF